MYLSKKKQNSSDAENLGAKFYNEYKDSKENSFTINSDTAVTELKTFVGYFLHGLKLKSYSFEKYKSNRKNKSMFISVIGKNKPSYKEQLKFKSIEEGTFYARDLVSEAGNILHPDEYAKRLNSLKKIGLKINIYESIICL